MGDRKVSSMLYILVSFIPWIIYWVLCSMEYKLGVAIPSAISLTLIIPQIRKRDYNPMDIASLLYFSIAIIGVYIFNFHVFIEMSGFLSYLTLFLMAISSIIIKQPFTLQVSKMDYPEIYWKDRQLLIINNLMTSVWAVIFLSNAIIFLLITKPLSIIFSNTLIAIGVIFSIIFPSKAVTYFALKEFRKYDWIIKVDTGRPKREYDVIIVGSGIGGLTCGALLSKRDYKVLVLEQHCQIGGYCSSFKRNNFVFNAGVSDVSGLWEKGPVAYLLKELGLKKEELFVRNTIRYVFKGKKIEARNLDEFMTKLSEIFPEEKMNIYAFLMKLKELTKSAIKMLKFTVFHCQQS